jgi:hypothetical protein
MYIGLGEALLVREILRESDELRIALVAFW